MNRGHKCPCKVVTPETDRFISVTKEDFKRGVDNLPKSHHRTLTFFTPIVDTGGSIEAPLGLSCHSKLYYTAGEGAPDTTCHVLADTLPVSWTGPAGVDHGRDLSYKTDNIIHQDLCRDNYPMGRLCSASRMVARKELDNILDRYRLKDTTGKFSTPSGHRGRRMELDKMTGNKADMDLMVADTMQERKRYQNLTLTTDSTSIYL